MSPGALLLGNSGQCFTCGHQHGVGDRCLSFHLTPELVEGVASACGARRARFTIDRIPPRKSSAALVARAWRLMDSPFGSEEFALQLLAFALAETGDCGPPTKMPRHERVVAEVVRFVEESFPQPLTLATLARRANLSPYYFLRVYKRIAGLTPHQHLLRTRMRAATEFLARTSLPVTEVAYAVGFENLANFTSSFHAEFRQTPSAYRRETQARDQSVRCKRYSPSRSQLTPSLFKR